MSFGTPVEAIYPRVWLNITHVSTSLTVIVEFPLRDDGPTPPSTRSESRVVVQALIDAIADSGAFTVTNASVQETNDIPVTPTP